jgi:hypothetical protein
MLRETKRAVLLALIAIISACQSQPVTYYTPPTGIPLEDSATFIGSKVPIRNIFFTDEITYVRRIDDFPVEDGSKSYDMPVQVSPGKHTIEVGFAQGSGCANAVFEVNAESRRTYITRSEKLAREGLFRLQNLRIWIEDSEGNKVTDDAIVPFSYCGGGFGFIFV